jgi:hypothetical protein
MQDVQDVVKECVPFIFTVAFSMFQLAKLARAKYDDQPVPSEYTQQILIFCVVYMALTYMACRSGRLNLAWGVAMSPFIMLSLFLLAGGPLELLNDIESSFRYIAGEDPIHLGQH